MNERTASAPPSRRERRTWSRRRWRRIIQIGCLPLTLLAAGGLIVLFALLAFSSPPPWVYDPRSYVIGGRLGAAATVLFVLQIVYTWVIGLLAANAGAQAARGQGATLRLRLRIVRQRFFIPILATLLLRIGVLIVVALAYLYEYTRVFGSPVVIGFPRSIETYRRETLFAIAMLGVALPYWLSGPFLRVRFSTALGALAGTWSYRTDERTSIALSARLGMGLAGVLALMWGGTILILVMLAIVNPAAGYAYSYYNPYQSARPLDANQIAVMGMTVVAVMLGGQVIVSELLTRLTERRLAGMRWPVRKRWLAVPLEGSQRESAAT